MSDSNKDESIPKPPIHSRLNDPEYLEQYNSALNEFVSKSQKIIEYKKEKAFEMAKVYANKPQFQLAILEFRKRWHLEVCPFNEGVHPVFQWHSDKITESIPGKQLTEEDLDKIWEDLEATLIKPFGLNKEHDSGLVIAAVTWGVTPENLENHWEEISFPIAKDFTPGSQFFIEDSYTRIGNHLVIVLLIELLERRGLDRTKLPRSVQFRIEEAQILAGTDNMSLKQIILVLERISTPNPNEDLVKRLELYLKIEPDTSLADIERTWPQIELRRAELWGTRPKRPKNWKNYDRDMELYNLFQKYKDYGKVIKIYDQRHPGEFFLSEGYITPSDFDKARQIIKRTKRRVTEK